MIKSIFGLTPREVREKQIEQELELAAQLQKQGTSPFAATFGVSFGAGLGRGLMSRLGYEDPEMAEAKLAEAKQEELTQKLSELAPDDPARSYILAQYMLEAGDVGGAATQMSQGNALEMAQRKENRAKEKFDYQIQKDLYERERQRLEAGGAKNLDTMYHPNGTPINVWERNNQQFAMINGSEVPIQNLPEPLLKYDPTDGGNTKPFIPSIPTKPEKDQVRSLLESMDITLPKETMELYTNRLAQTLQIAKDDFIKTAKKMKKPDAKWNGDEEWLRANIESDMKSNILKYESGIFGIGGEYSLNYKK